ncbi:MAG: TauD/TfdA family dioxygenase [Pseudomonadota bacterium]
MGSILTKRIDGGAAWLGTDFETDDSWIVHLTEADAEAIDAALRAIRDRGLAPPRFSAAEFPIGPLSARLAALADELENGRGFFVLRGLPVGRYSEEEIDAIYFGLGLHLGTPVGQNPEGDLIGRVMAVGDPAKKETRVFQTSLYLPYHTDPSDVVGLLCHRKAKRGGLSSLVSAASIHNALLERHPEHLGLFYRAYPYAHMSLQGPLRTPLFHWHEGKLTCRYLRQYIELGAEQMGQPLSAVEIEAFDLFDAIMAEPERRLDMMLEPGDMQFANNYMVLHSRTSFEDHEAPEMRRRLLRLWLKMPNARAQGSEFPGRNGFPIPAERYA